MRVFIFNLLRFKDIYNNTLNTVVSGTSDNDYIKNITTNVSVNGGAGNDSIYNDGGKNFSVSGGLGNDLISLIATGGLIKYASGDGNDTIYGFNESDTLTITGGSFSTAKSGDNVIVTVGKGKITLVGAKDKQLNINKNAVPKLITFTDGDDWFWNYESKVTVSGGNGNDTIQNSGYGAVIDVGNGNDSIRNFNSEVTINGGNGNDYISNWGGSVSAINGGAGDDSVWNDADNISINGGAGNDRISLIATGGLIQYASGDGNDTVWGFNESDTLTITSGSYSTQTSGDNVLVNVGKGSILLIGAKDKQLNINKNTASKLITLTDGNDRIENYESKVTMNGGKGNDDITNKASKVTINGGAGNDEINNWSSLSAINGGEGKDTILNDTNASKVTIDGGAGSDYIVNYGSLITINGGDGNDEIANYASKATISGGGGNDYIEINGDNVLFKYNAGDGNDKIYGFKSDSTLSISGSEYSTTKSGKNIIVTVGDGKITLVGAASLSAVNIKGTLSGGGNVGVSINNTLSNTLLTGTSGGDSIQNGWYDDDKDKLVKGGKNVTIETGAGNDYVYNNCYFEDDGSYYYDDQYGSNVLFKYSSGDGNDKIYGFNKTSTLSISGGSFSTQESGNDVIVTVGEGTITLVDAASLSKLNIDGEEAPIETNSWTLDGSTAKYGTANKTLVTVSGVKSTGGLSLNNKVVTVANSSLNQKKVTISDGYTLKLADDVNVPSTTKAWSYENSKATYKQITSAGYKLTNNAINYSKASSKTLATVSGVKSKDGLKVSGTTITVSNAVLNQKKVTVSDGYTLKLGDDVTKSTSKAIGWTKSGSTATYKTASTTAGYKLTNNQINYVKKSGGATLATVKGVKNTGGLSVKNKVVTLKKSSLNNKVTLGGSYEFNLAAGDYNKTTISGSASADVITSNGKNLSINGGAGNDTINILGSGTTVTGGAGKDVYVYSGGSGRITDFGTTDTLRIGNGTGTYSSETNGKNLIVTVGNNKLTLVGAANLSSPSIAGTKKTDSEGVVVDGKKVTLTEDYMEESFSLANEYSTILTVNASAVPLDIKITGNKLMNSILGGAGNDTLSGGKGNDKLDGGDGTDVFVYKSGDGNDTILNYAEEDRISIASGSVDKISVNNKDVILTVGNGKITVKDAADKIVTYVAGGKTIGYLNEVMIEDNIATLTDKYAKKKFNVADYGSNIREINAEFVANALNITGNEKANLIIGTWYDDTISGGAGGDTLQGGNGADIFVYKKGDGNDVITDYKAEDKISIASGAVSDVVDYDGKDVIFSIGSYKITVKNGNGKQITLIDRYGETTSKIYKSSSLWFTQDDTDFSIADNQLGSIVKSSASNYSFGTSTDFTSLIQKNNLITYGGKK